MVVKLKIRFGLIFTRNTGKKIPLESIMTSWWLKVDGQEETVTNRETIYDDDLKQVTFATTLKFNFSSENESNLKKILSEIEGNDKYNLEKARKRAKDILDLTEVFINDKFYGVVLSKDEILLDIYKLIKQSEFMKINRNYFKHKEDVLKRRVNLFLDKGFSVSKVSHMMNLTEDEINDLRNKKAV